MAGYTKVFGRILDSTVWALPSPIRILWITMLAMAGPDGIVESSVPGLAHRAHISLDDCVAGLKCFQEPDPYSLTITDEGRRIRVVDGRGWLLINHGKYRALMSGSDRQERSDNNGSTTHGYVYYAVAGDVIKIGFSQNPWSRVHELKTANPRMELVAVERGSKEQERERHERFKSDRTDREWFNYSEQLRQFVATLREQRSDGSNDSSHKAEASPTPTPTTQKIKSVGTHPTLEEVTRYCQERGGKVDAQRWFDHYEANGWKVGRNAMKDWKAAVRTWERPTPTNENNKCARHPDSGLTQWGTCWSCYSEEHGSP